MTLKENHFRTFVSITKFLIITLSALFFILGCTQFDKKKNGKTNTLHIIHAGSLAVPVKMITEAYRKENPEVEFFTEAWGSKAGARRITEIKTPCDIFLSADYVVIENMLIPEHASWYIKFAANEMAIVYTEKSTYAELITSDNWHEILLLPEVHIARSNPDHDPCGVRTVFAVKLAELYYQIPGLASKFLEKDIENIRPKETDLIALLQSGQVDYIFLYSSVAKQHGLSWVHLPSEVSQNNPMMEEWYSKVTAETLGTAPGSKIIETGKSMVYGLTIPKISENTKLAEHFLEFMLDNEKGMLIMEELGQPSVVPSPTLYYNAIPEKLKGFATME